MKMAPRTDEQFIIIEGRVTPVCIACGHSKSNHWNDGTCKTVGCDCSMTFTIGRKASSQGKKKVPLVDCDMCGGQTVESKNTRHNVCIQCRKRYRRLRNELYMEGYYAGVKKGRKEKKSVVE